MDLADLRRLCDNTLISHLGIEITSATPACVCGSMPVTDCVKQPFGSLHGGASVVLLETVASVGANLNVDLQRQYCVGLEVNANHLKAVRSGILKATAAPLHVGGRTQVWTVEIRDAEEARVCVGRITLAVLDKAT